MQSIWQWVCEVADGKNPQPTGMNVRNGTVMKQRRKPRTKNTSCCHSNNGNNFFATASKPRVAQYPSSSHPSVLPRVIRHCLQPNDVDACLKIITVAFNIPTRWSHF